jgi:hypothetical protein
MCVCVCVCVCVYVCMPMCQPVQIVHHTSMWIAPAVQWTNVVFSCVPLTALSVVPLPHIDNLDLVFGQYVSTSNQVISPVVDIVVEQPLVFLLDYD